MPLHDPIGLLCSRFTWRSAVAGNTGPISLAGFVWFQEKEYAPAEKWLREAGVRGDLQGLMKYGLLYEENRGAVITQNLPLSWAAYTLCATIGVDDPYQATEAGVCQSAANALLKKDLQTTEQQAEAEAYFLQLRDEYTERRDKAWADQRARREAVLPEVRKQIDEWMGKEGNRVI